LSLTINVLDGDRAYMQPERMAAVLEAGADIVVRAKWNGARWLDAEGGKFDLIKKLKRAKKDCLDLPIWIGRKDAKPLALRLIAIRKPPEAAEQARQKLKARAKEKQRVLQDATLVASTPREVSPAPICRTCSSGLPAEKAY
jgi:hypothetical protein